MPFFYTSTKADSALVSAPVFIVKNELNENFNFFYSNPRFTKKPISKSSTKTGKKSESRLYRTASVSGTPIHQYNNPDSSFIKQA